MIFSESKFLLMDGDLPCYCVENYRFIEDRDIRAKRTLNDCYRLRSEN